MKWKAATSTGIVGETRARFGFPAAPGSTDDGRLRRSTDQLPPAHARRLFKGDGRRAEGLLVEFNDIDHVELDY